MLTIANVLAGGDFGFGHEDIVSAASARGIGRIVFDSTLSGHPVSGNTSVDDFQAQTSDAVPEPGTLALLDLGLVGLAARQRRRR